MSKGLPIKAELLSVFVFIIKKSSIISSSKYKLWSQTACIQAHLLLTSYVTLGRLLNLSMPVSLSIK